MEAADLRNIQDPVGFQAVMFSEPHEKQIEILRSVAKNKIIAAGRRFGKTKLIGREWIRGALTQEFKRQCIIAPTYKQVMINFETIKGDLYESELVGFVEKLITSPYPKIVFKNGSIIDFGSSDNFDSIRGQAYDRICLDEAGFVPDAAMAAIRPLIFDTGAPLWKIGTPNGKNHFFDDFVKQDKDFASFQFSSFENPYISQEEVTKEIRQYGENSLYVRTEIFAEFIEDQNSVFPWKDIMACVDDKIQLVTKGNPGRKYVLGADLAKYEDFTVIVVVDVTQEPFKLAYFERFNRMPWQYVVDRITDVSSKFVCYQKFVDSTGVGDPILEQLQKNTSMSGFKFSSKSKLDLVTYLAGFIINHKILYPAIRELVEELKYFEFVKSVHSTAWKMEAHQGFHDDTVCALGLALMAAKGVDASGMGFYLG